jgi:hypothetical protein
MVGVEAQVELQISLGLGDAALGLAAKKDERATRWGTKMSRRRLGRTAWLPAVVITDGGVFEDRRAV